MTRRATHVDVDDVGAGSFRDAGAFGHPVRLAARELHDMKRVAVALGTQNRARVSLHQILARRHLGDDKTGPKSGSQSPERRVGHAGHRRKNDVVGQCNITNCDPW